VSASVNLLQSVIDTCCEDLHNRCQSFSSKLYLDMKFNASKSNIICYGPKCTDLNIELHVNSIAIPRVNRVKYLGVYLMSAKSFKVCWLEPKKKFFRAVNGLFSNCTSTMNDTVYYIV